MAIRLVATDMDGTLLNDKKELPQDFGAWVRSHPDIYVVIASGRQIFTLKRDLEDLSDDLIYITDNGGLAFYHDEIIYEDLMTPEDVQATLDAASTIPGCVPIICGVNCAYMAPGDNEGVEQGRMYYARLELGDFLHGTPDGDRVVKIALFIPDFKAEEVRGAFPKLPDSLLATLSGTSWIDVANRTVNKGAAMLAIQKRLGVKPEECMAFGDYPNDIEMLEVCGESYCMENGHESVRAVARHTAPSNEEAGVMQVLRTTLP